MKLNQLVSKPQLIKVEISEPDIVAKYGEPLEFYTWDRQPLDVFMKLASGAGEKEIVFDMLKGLILDESGQPLLVDEGVLPTDVLIVVLNKITEILGK